MHRRSFLHRSAAGALADSVSLGFTSNANGVTGLNNATLAAGTLTVTGAAYDLARATVASALALGNVRVGATADLAVANTVISTAAFQDDLSVAAAGANAKLAYANPANIAAGNTGNVGLTVLAAGSLSDSVTLTLGSKALTVSGLADASLAAKSVAVTGAAYDYAQAAYASSVSLGNVRRGAALTRAIANTVATAAAYQDNLLVTASTTNANLAVLAPAAAIAAGATGDLTFTASAVGSLAANVALGLQSVALGGTGLDNLTLTAGDRKSTRLHSSHRL